MSGVNTDIETGLAVIVPAYNEENGIDCVLQQLIECLQDYKLSYEIVVVDDGSQDKTAAIAKSYSNVKVICHQVNQGYGAAIKTGIRHTRAELIGIIDADGTYPANEVLTLVDELRARDIDMLVGARTGEKVSIPLIRKPAKWIVRQVGNFVAGQTIPDLNSGLRVFRRQAILSFLSILPNGFSFTTTITLAMLTNGYFVDYHSINYKTRIGHSKFKPIQDTYNLVSLLLRIALYFVPLKVFLPLSGIVLLTAIMWAILSKYLLGQLADVSTLILAMTSIQIAMIGMLAELINRRLPNHYRQE